MNIEQKLATLIEQGKWIIRELESIKTDSKETKEDVKHLMAFRWKSVGALSLIAFLATACVEILRGI